MHTRQDRFASARGARILLTLAAVSGAAGGCSSRPSTCVISVANFGGYDERSYCVASQQECEAACAALEGRSDIGGCDWDESGYCDSDLPATIPVNESACAIHLTVSCGGGAPSTSVMCHDCGVVTPGAYDYDPSLGCTSEWGTEVARASDCAQAIDELEGGGGECEWVNDGECDEPEGTNSVPRAPTIPTVPDDRGARVREAVARSLAFTRAGPETRHRAAICAAGVLAVARA